MSAQRSALGPLWDRLKSYRDFYSPDGFFNRELAAYHQQEALQGLYLELKLQQSLPATRGWAASPDFLLTLTGYALARKPQVIVECGSGVSTVVLARCAQLNGHGHVFSLDHERIYANATRANLLRLGLGAHATVLDRALTTVESGGARWPWYDDEPLSDAPIDLLMVDGPPTNLGPTARYPAARLIARLSPTGVVLVDDADRPDERAMLRRWALEFPELQQTRLPCEKGCVVLKRSL